LSNHLYNISSMSFNHRTCAGQQTEAKPRPQEPVCVAFVNLTGAAQQDL
jgi:hypothetical protein